MVSKKFVGKTKNIKSKHDQHPKILWNRTNLNYFKKI